MHLGRRRRAPCGTRAAATATAAASSSRAWPFRTAAPAPCPWPPTLDGLLHALVVSPATARWPTTSTTTTWGKQTWETAAALDPAAGLRTASAPAVVAFHNKLFLVFVRDGALLWSFWALAARRWAVPQLVAPPPDPDNAEAAARFRGVPALFVIDGVLHALCMADSDDRDIIGFRFDYVAQAWARCDDVSEGRAASGVSAASYGDRAYLGFLDGTAVRVAALRRRRLVAPRARGRRRRRRQPAPAGRPQRPHPLRLQRRRTRPQPALVLAPALTYALTAWMARLPDDAPLSALTVPGTHDTCARSNIPFVRTQYLSVAQQLALGIRCLDLRLRRHADGQLHCYHGGIPIDFPHGLSFADVMAEVSAFLRGPGAADVVLVSHQQRRPLARRAGQPRPLRRRRRRRPGRRSADARRRPRLVCRPGHAAPGRCTRPRRTAAPLRRRPGRAARCRPRPVGLARRQPRLHPGHARPPPGVRVRLQDKWKYGRTPAPARPDRL